MYTRLPSGISHAVALVFLSAFVRPRVPVSHLPVRMTLAFVDDGVLSTHPHLVGPLRLPDHQNVDKKVVLVLDQRRGSGVKNQLKNDE